MKFSLIEEDAQEFAFQKKTGSEGCEDAPTNSNNFQSDNLNQTNMQHETVQDGDDDQNKYANIFSSAIDDVDEVDNNPFTSVTQDSFAADSEKSDVAHNNLQQQISVKKKVIGGGTLSVNPTRMCVMGIGGGGVNATNKMVDCGLKDIDIVAVNTDVQSLESCLASTTFPLRHNNRGGLGAGGNPLRAAEAARYSRNDIYEYVKDFDILFLAAGLGGGTGTGATPVIAEIAREAGVLTLGVVTLPFMNEGDVRIGIAQAGLQELEESIDALLVIPNDNITKNNITSQDIRLVEGFQTVDLVLTNTVKSIAEIITKTSIMNIDFADIESCLTNAGHISVGFGAAEHEESTHENVQKAVEMALKNTVLSQENIEVMKRAKHIIASTVAGPDMTMKDFQEISDMIVSRIDSDATLGFKHGYRIEPDWEKRIEITIIASEKEYGINSSYTRAVGEHGQDTSLQSNKMASKLGMEGRWSSDSNHGASYSQREILEVKSNYVKADTFDKMLSEHDFAQNEDEDLDYILDQEKLNVPTVKRMLSTDKESESVIASKVEHPFSSVTDKTKNKLQSSYFQRA